jgi:hypothetical protein
MSGPTENRFDSGHPCRGSDWLHGAPIDRMSVVSYAAVLGLIGIVPHIRPLDHLPRA